LVLEAFIFVAIVMFLVLRANYYFSFGPAKPDVVIFMVDTLRADRLGCYGHQAPTSPFIDKMASGGVLFEDCRSQFPWTKPSIASLFTSLYCSAHQVTAMPELGSPDLKIELGRHDVLPQQMTTLAEVFQEDGYRTAAFITNRWIDPLFGFHQGFDDFHMLTRVPDKTGKNMVFVPNQPASFVNSRLMEYLLENKPPEHDKWLAGLGIHRRPYFIYLHYMDVHGPYWPPAPFTKMFDPFYAMHLDRKLNEQEIEALHGLYEGVDSLNFYNSRYDAQIRYFDYELQKLMGYIEKEGLLGPSVMVLASDHGESFGEHNGKFDHGNSLYEEEISVPLIIWGGPGITKAARSRTPAQVIDIGPTVLSAVGIKIPEQFEGIDLLEVMSRGDDPHRITWSEISIREKAQTAKIEGRKKMLFETKEGRVSELYDLDLDPAEKNDLSDDMSQKEKNVQTKQISSWLDEESKKIDITDEAPEAILTEDVRRELEALGYLK